MDEIVGHTYLFLKEQLEIFTMPPPSGVLHGTIIGAVLNHLDITCAVVTDYRCIIIA